MKKNKKIIIGTVSVLLVATLVFLTVGIPIIKKNKMLKRADSLVAIGKYEEGINIYDQLLTDNYSEEIMYQRDVANEIMESNTNFEKGMEAFDDGENNKAIKYLSRVSKNDKKQYEKATEEIKDVEKVIFMEVEDLIDNSELDEAKEMVNEYLKIIPKNTEMENIKDKINFQQKEDKKKMSEEEDKKENEDKTKKITSVKNIETSKAEKKASNIIGSYQYITSTKANLRANPVIGGKVLNVLGKGDYVYIRDTHFESEDRIWCLVNVVDTDISGWISYNTMNYTIK